MTTRLQPLEDRVVGSDSFGLTNYDKLQADVDYLVVAGADLASATTIDITSEFHGITGTTTIDNITDLLGAAAGQQVRLWIKAGPVTIRNNGSGTGNIRTATGGDRVCSPNKVIAFVYDGTNWRESSNSEILAYGKKTSDVSTTGSSFAAGADLLASALSFTADGSSDYVVEVASRAWLSSASGDIFADINLDTASGGILANYTSPGTGQAIPLRASGVIVAPTAGAHTANVRIYAASGSPTITVKGNIGGAGASVPILAWVRKA